MPRETERTKGNRNKNNNFYELQLTKAMCRPKEGKLNAFILNK